MTRARGRHRQHADVANTLDGDAEFFGLNHTQREHYTDRNFAHSYTYRPHPAEKYALIYFIAGWLATVAAAFTLLYWLIA